MIPISISLYFSKMNTVGDAYVAAAWLHSTDPEEETERYDF
jgi:hypothetical protein